MFETATEFIKALIDVLVLGVELGIIFGIGFLFFKGIVGFLKYAKDKIIGE